MKATHLWCVAAVALSLTCACKGDVSLEGSSNNGYGGLNNGANNGANNGGTNGDDPNAFACDPDQAPVEVPLKRLSNEQYLLTLIDLIEWAAPAASGDVWQSVADVVTAVPEDTRTGDLNDVHGGFSRLDQALQQQHVDGSLEAAVAIGTALTSTPARLGELAGACATDADTANDDACIDDWINRFGERALRRPLTDDDRTFYRSVFASDVADPDAFRDVVAVMLTAPDFLYHVESGTDGTDGQENVFELDAFELANRLAYHFWQSMPDVTLYEKARDGTLLDPQVYEGEVQRVFANAKTQRSVERFYREWLWLDEVPQLDGLVGTNLYDNFAGPNVPTSDLRDAMIDEVVGAAQYHTVNDGSFADFFMSPQSFTQSAELAAIYGVQPWDGTGEPPAFDDPNRVGVFTRAAFLATGTAGTRPVMKGFFLRKGLMCTTPPPPPDNAAANAEINLRPDMTTREVVEEITEQPGTNCAGCHQQWLNNLGYPTENYDGLGRARTHQQLFDENGDSIGEKEVDTSAIPRVLADDDTAVEGAPELAELIADSGLVEACYARNYVRFTYGRLEDDVADGCALEATRSLLREGASLSEVMVAVALRPEFRRRTVTP